jgi:hypothetical protein
LDHYLVNINSYRVCIHLSDSAAHLPQAVFNLYNGWALRGIQCPAHPDYFPQLIAHLCRLEASEGAIMSLMDDLQKAFAI